MAKWKERVNKILDAEQARLNEKYRDAEGCYRDTGYDRYYNMMNRCEKELEDLYAFRNSKIMIAENESKLRRYRKVINEYFKSLAAYTEDHKGVERPIEETVSVLKHRLQQALNEEGLL